MFYINPSFRRKDFPSLETLAMIYLIVVIVEKLVGLYKTLS
jgi:hypothetical protein